MNKFYSLWRMGRPVLCSILLLAALAVFIPRASALQSPPPGSPAPARPEIWRYTLDNPAIETIMVDIDGNGFRDFLMLDNGKLYSRLETGYPIWKKRNAELDAVRVDSVITVCNLDAQGPAEILVDAGGDVWVIDGGTMATLVRLPQTQVAGLTDLNGDGAAEIYTTPRAAATEYPPPTVYGLVKGKLKALWTHAGCQLMRKPSQDAYQVGEKNNRFYILDLADDGKADDVMAALPDGKGWIGLGFDEKGQFGQTWEFSEIQDGASRLKFLDWTDGNYDTYYDILAYQYDTRRVFNSDVVSMGDSIGSFPLRHIDEPPSSAKALKVDRVKRGEWPMRHRDARYTGRSPLKLSMKEAPQEAWSHPVAAAAPAGLSMAELDGKPGADLLVAARGCLSAYASDGKPLWKSEYLGAPRVDGFYDLDGDGKNEMLVYYRKVNSEPAYGVFDPATGKRLWEFKTSPYLGGGARLWVGKYLPKNKGLQIFSWGAYGFYADLTFFDFSEGYEKAAKPVWEQHPEHVIYPTEDVYDFDSDGNFEYVLLEHSRLRIFDIATGKKKRDFEWGKYRSYGSMLPVKFGDDPIYKLLVTSWNSMLVVEMIDINETSGSLMWKIPGKVGFRTGSAADAYRLGTTTRIGDLDGDGKPEIAYLKLNESHDQKWHAYIRDLKTGKLKKDIPLKIESIDASGSKTVKEAEDQGFEEAGIKGFKEPPPQPARPEKAKPAAPPPGSWRIVDAATGKVELVDAAGKVTASLAVPEAVTGMIYNPLVADLNGDGKPEIVIPQNPNSENRTFKADQLILEPAAQPGQPPALMRKDGGELLLIFDRKQDGKNDRLYLEPDPEGSRLVLKDGADKTVWATVIPGDPDILQQVVCGDFNGDGVIDVFTNFYHGEMNRPTGKKIFTINGEYVRRAVWNGKDGQMLWHACNVMGGERPFDYASFPTVYDVNGDGKDDIISFCPDILTVASGADGKLIYDPCYTKSFWSRAGALYNIPFLDDLDGDGKIEIYGQRACAGTCVMRLPNEPMWANAHEDQGQYSLISDSNFQGVADVDGDGKMEIGVGLRKGEFRCYGAEDGHLQWSVFIGSPTSEVCSADVDGDGKMEFLFGTEEGFLYAVGGGDGEKDPVKWKVNLGAPVGSPIVADVNGDGKGVILVCTGDGRLRCLAGRK